MQKISAQQELHKKAIHFKRKYLVDGIFKNEQMYGPSGIFYKLSQSCFKIDWSEYTFDVCPYKRVTQTKKAHRDSQMNLGERASLILADSRNEKVWIIKMDDGDNQLCGKARRSEVCLFLLAFNLLK